METRSSTPAGNRRGDSDINQVGMTQKSATAVVQSLNKALANYQIFYQNLRAFHWLVKGHHFFELHEKFEKMYDNASEAIDDIAERILTLDGTPLHSYEDYLKNAEVKSVANPSGESPMVQAAIENSQVVLAALRAVIDESAQQGDDGTNDMAIGFARQLEKDIWMLNAWLG
ncbi:DNA starvation/stationary phase protection protein [Pontibacter sp. G13]|uniref:Dps family protein n=1 Tax=Pontibacter sp. G13 TaxID=3074898 RepID=UPI002889ECD8|nr:DNA starvation/stationary phase protection protein [Pontibacter sp. G13]WNJ18549.1 DNA starvation/stationary phase protection protein [Pontibacter sp. G13]